jgi:hypothetical protein
MSNSSYAILNNSTDKLDVAIPLTETGSPSVSTSSSDVTLKHHYVQIAIAVALYWYDNASQLSSLYLLRSQGGFDRHGVSE